MARWIGKMSPYMARRQLEFHPAREIAALLIQIDPLFAWLDLMMRGLQPEKRLAVLKWLVRHDALVNKEGVKKYVVGLLEDAEPGDLARILGPATLAVTAVVLGRVYRFTASRTLEMMDPARVVAIVRELGYDPRREPRPA